MCFTKTKAGTGTARSSYFVLGVYVFVLGGDCNPMPRHSPPFPSTTQAGYYEYRQYLKALEVRKLEIAESLVHRRDEFRVLDARIAATLKQQE